MSLIFSSDVKNLRLKGVYMKYCSLCLFTMLMVNMSSSVASPYSSLTYKSLDDSTLAKIVGQGGSIQTATDPHPLYEYRLVMALNQFLNAGQQTDLTQLTSMFYINDSGQTALQINAGVVSIGTIEFRLNMEGLNEMANTFAEEMTISY